MATINSVRKGIKIIRKYLDKEEFDDDNFQAIDSQIYCGEYTGDEMTPKHLAKMKRLGWFKDEDSWSFHT